MTDPRHLDVLIAGAQKAGTTSLAAYLGAHPCVAVHPTLELPYFVDDRRYARGWTSSYREHFRGCEPAHGELLLGKSVGVMFLPDAARRAHDHNPQLKVIVSVREPVARAYSAYRFLRARGLETATSFGEALELEPARLAQDFARMHPLAYAGRGRYAEQIERLRSQFGDEQVHVVVAEELAADPDTVLRDLCAFLGLPEWQDDLLARVTAERHNETERVGRAPLGLERVAPRLRWIAGPRARTAVRRMLTRAQPPPVRREPHAEARLRDLMAPHNERLWTVLGRRIDAWDDRPRP